MNKKRIKNDPNEPPIKDIINKINILINEN